MKNYIHTKFEANMKTITVLWGITPCSLVGANVSKRAVPVFRVASKSK